MPRHNVPQEDEKRFAAPAFLRQRMSDEQRGKTGTLRFIAILLCCAIGLGVYLLARTDFQGTEWPRLLFAVALLATPLATYLVTIDDDDPSVGRWIRVVTTAGCGAAFAAVHEPSMTNILLASSVGAAIGASSWHMFQDS